MVKTGSGFIEWLAIILYIAINSYDDPAAKVSEEHSVSGVFVAVVRELGGDAFKPQYPLIPVCTSLYIGYGSTKVVKSGHRRSLFRRLIHLDLLPVAAVKSIIFSA
jgi:hypothetical protein